MAAADKPKEPKEPKVEDMEDEEQDEQQQEMLEPPLPPDGGWGWVIVAASFVTNVLVDGVCFSFGIFYLEFLESYGESKAMTSWVGSVLNGMYLSMGKSLTSLYLYIFPFVSWCCRIKNICWNLLALICMYVSRMSQDLGTSSCMPIAVYCCSILDLVTISYTYLPCIYATHLNNFEAFSLYTSKVRTIC